VAQSYLRTIEFKVKDAALKDAVNKLGKSLGSIDKNVAQINKSFTGLSKSLKGVAAEFRQIAKSSEKLAKSSGKQKSPIDPKQLTKSAIGIKKIKSLLADLNQKGALTVGSGKTADFNKELNQLKATLENISGPGGSLAQTEAGLRKQANAFNTIAANSRVSTDATKVYAQAVTGLTKAEQALSLAQLKRVQVQKTTYAKGAGGGFKNTQDLLKMEGSDEVGKTIAGLAIYRGELEKALSVTDMTSKEFQDIGKTIERINKQLAEGTKIKTKEQDLNAQAKKDAKERLDLAIKEHRARQDAMKDMIKQINIGGKFASKGLGSFFGLLQGKKGTLPQVAAGGTLLETIKGLVKFLPFVDKRIKDNIRSYADLGEKALIVIGGIRLASIGLSGVLGATAWVTNAVKGFIQFEDVASKVIWSIEGQMGKAFSLFGRLARELPQLASAAMMLMPQALGGPGFGLSTAAGFFGKGSAFNQVGSGIGGLMDGRNETRRFRRQGPTELTKNQEILDRLNTKLNQRNRTASDYVKILNQAVHIEQKISQETRMQNIMREHANGTIARQIRQQDLALRKQRRDKRRDRRQAFQDRREAFEFQQAEFNAQTFMQPGTQAAMVPGRDPNRRVRKDVWARYQRMQQSRKQRRGRLNEGLMLGAGFPMLFGGGVGSVGGGVAGALLQSKMGPGAGFGAQILLSALGQQIDAFVGKTKELGDALRRPTENLQALRDAAGIAGTDIDRTSKRLEQLGLKASAAALVQAEISDFADIEGLQAMSEAWQDLSNIIAKLTIQTMSFISGPLTAAIRKMEEILGHSVDAGVLQKTYDKLDKPGRDAFNQRLRELMPERTKHRGIEHVFRTTPFEKIRQGKIPPSVLNQMQAEFDPKTAPALQEALNAKVKAITERDTSDLKEKIALEKERLNMKDSEFDIKNKEIEIARQGFEIEWQRGELRQMEDGLEKDLLQTKIEKLVVTRDLNKAELENARILADPVKSSIIQLTKELKNLGDARYQLVQAAQAIGNAFSESFKGIISGSMTAQQALANLFQRTADHFLDMAAQMIAKQIQMKILGIGLNWMGGGLNLPTDFYSGSGGGGVSWTDIAGKAAGGPVKGGESYVVGEEGPELFVPNSSGNIVPNDELGGGGGTSIVVNVDASGSSVEGQEEQARELGDMLAAAIQAEIVKQKRPGGLLA